MAEPNEDELDQDTGSTETTKPATSSKEADPVKTKHAERVKEVKAALASFPTLAEGYVTPRGVYFDKTAALASVDEDEDQVTVVKPAKKK